MTTGRINQVTIFLLNKRTFSFTKKFFYLIKKKKHKNVDFFIKNNYLISKSLISKIFKLKINLKNVK